MNDLNKEYLMKQSQEFINSTAGKKLLHQLGKDIFDYVQSNPKIKGGFYYVKTFHQITSDVVEDNEFYVLQYTIKKLKFHNFKLNKGFLRWLGIRKEFRLVDTTIEVHIDPAFFVFAMPFDEFSDEATKIKKNGVKIGDYYFEINQSQAFEDFQRVMSDSYIALHASNKPEAGVRFDYGRGDMGTPPLPKGMK